jgi:hypothetical protein
MRSGQKGLITQKDITVFTKGCRELRRLYAGDHERSMAKDRNPPNSASLLAAVCPEASARSFRRYVFKELPVRNISCINTRTGFG